MKNLFKKISYLPLLLALVIAGAGIAFATPPTSPFTSSDQELNPTCAHGDLNCYVLGDNIYSSDGTLSSFRTVDGNGNGFDMHNLETANIQSTKDFFLESNDRVFIKAINTQGIFNKNYLMLNSGANPFYLATPAVNATTAIAGQVLTLSDAGTGQIEYQNAAAGTLSTYPTTAAAAGDGALLSGSYFKVSNSDGTSTVHVKD